MEFIFGFIGCFLLTKIIVVILLNDEWGDKESNIQIAFGTILGIALVEIIAAFS